MCRSWRANEGRLNVARTWRFVVACPPSPKCLTSKIVVGVGKEYVPRATRLRNPAPGRVFKKASAATARVSIRLNDSSEAVRARRVPAATFFSSPDFSFPVLSRLFGSRRFRFDLCVVTDRSKLLLLRLPDSTSEAAHSVSRALRSRRWPVRASRCQSAPLSLVGFVCFWRNAAHPGAADPEPVSPLAVPEGSSRIRNPLFRLCLSLTR